MLHIHYFNGLGQLEEKQSCMVSDCKMIVGRLYLFDANQLEHWLSLSHSRAPREAWLLWPWPREAAFCTALGCEQGRVPPWATGTNKSETKEQNKIFIFHKLSIFKRFYLFIFRERGKEGEREREKHQWVVAPRAS